jgi:hypothetical protein
MSQGSYGHESCVGLSFCAAPSLTGDGAASDGAAERVCCGAASVSGGSASSCSPATSSGRQYACNLRGKALHVVDRAQGLEAGHAARRGEVPGIFRQSDEVADRGTRHPGAAQRGLGEIGRRARAQERASRILGRSPRVRQSRRGAGIAAHVRAPAAQASVFDIVEGGRRALLKTGTSSCCERRRLPCPAFDFDRTTMLVSVPSGTYRQNRPCTRCRIRRGAYCLEITIVSSIA